MQIFPRSLNKLPLILGGVGTILPALLIGAIWYYLTPKNFQVGYAPTQPVPYSHRLHAGQMGMDCRYCHANVEVSAKAMIPPTQVCMGCHAMVKTDSARLAPLRASWESGKPVEWVQVHKLPDHAYFDHSAHLAAGVGCATCHGRIDQMETVRAETPLGMGWCLDRADVSVSGYAQLEGSKTWLLPGLDTLHWAWPRAHVSSLAATFAARAGRESALAVAAAVQYHVHRRIDLPKGASVARMPGPLVVKSPLIDASRKLAVAGEGNASAVEDDFVLEIATGTVPRSEYDAFVGAAHAADDGFLATTRVAAP